MAPTGRQLTKYFSIAAITYVSYKWYQSRKYVKPVIAVDLDEVLCQFLELMCRYLNDNNLFPKKYNVSDFNSYLFHEVWGGTKENATKIVQDFLKSDYFQNIDEMKQVTDAYQILKSLKSKFKFVVCTSRQLITKEATFKWIDKFYPNIFDEIRFGNHFGSGPKVSKPEMCKQLNARILIDDSSFYAKQSHSSLDYVIIFDWNGQYGWNKTKNKIAENVKRLHNWNEIQTFLNKYHNELQQN